MFALTDLPANMQAKITVEADCWVWTGATNNKGYGSVSAGTKSKSMLAHRKSYESVNGKIPAGLEIDHLCENPPCVNPVHLEAVSTEEHMRRVGHVNLKPIYSQHALNAYIPASKPTPVPDWIRNMRERMDAMTPEDVARRHRLHITTGTRCACEAVAA